MGRHNEHVHTHTLTHIQTHYQRHTTHSLAGLSPVWLCMHMKGHSHICPISSQAHICVCLVCTLIQGKYTSVLTATHAQVHPNSQHTPVYIAHLSMQTHISDSQRTSLTPKVHATPMRHNMCRPNTHVPQHVPQPTHSQPSLSRNFSLTPQL